MSSNPPSRRLNTVIGVDLQCKISDNFDMAIEYAEKHQYTTHPDKRLCLVGMRG